MRADALSRAFAAALPYDGGSLGQPSPPASLIGVEHEYVVLRNGVAVDFRTLIAGLELGRRYLDPADAHAYRLPSGAAVTCDDNEAEIALEPIATNGDYARVATERVEEEHHALAARLGDKYGLAGYSTHINLSIDADISVIYELAWRYARTFAAALMLVIGDRTAYGVGVRPRPARLELCCEYMAGGTLMNALEFAVGSVRACVANIHAPGRALPDLAVAPRPTTDRFGYCVHRGMFDGDLYAPDVRLRSSSGILSAQEYLREVKSSVAVHNRVPDARTSRVAGADPNPFGRLVGVQQRPQFEMAAVMLTWEVAVLVIQQRGRHRIAFACVPRAGLERFLESLDSGALDGIICGYLHTRHGRDRLSSREQAGHAGLYGSLGRRRALLQREIRPVSISELEAA